MSENAWQTITRVHAIFIVQESLILHVCLSRLVSACVIAVLVLSSQNALGFGSCYLAFDSYCKLNTWSKKVHFMPLVHNILLLQEKFFVANFYIRSYILNLCWFVRSSYFFIKSTIDLRTFSTNKSQFTCFKMNIHAACRGMNILKH